ncbi:MAG: hypothetical protein RR184_01590 [Citrobacter sp.]
MIRMEAEMSAYHSKNFSELSAFLSAVKDIGSATVAVLLAEVPELKRGQFGYRKLLYVKVNF